MEVGLVGGSRVKIHAFGRFALLGFSSSSVNFKRKTGCCAVEVLIGIPRLTLMAQFL